MNWQNMDSIESLQSSFVNVQKVRQRSNLAVLLLFANLLKNGLIKSLYFLHTASWDDIGQLSRDGFH